MQGERGARFLEEMWAGSPSTFPRLGATWGMGLVCGGVLRQP